MLNSKAIGNQGNNQNQFPNHDLMTLKKIPATKYIKVKETLGSNTKRVLTLAK